MNLTPSPLLNKHKEIRLWPSCKHPKTLSFRATTTDDHDLVFIDPKELLPEAEVELTMPGYYFSNSSESATASMSTESETYFDNNESSSVEIIVRGVKSERLFFKPDTTSAILETQGSGRQRTLVDIDGGVFPYKESVAMVMESEDPYGDFKKSMEEMMESLDLKDWDCLEELMGWYLRMNGKNNHEFIVGAFVDLLAGISGGDDSCSDHSIASFNSAASTFSSPISSPLYQVGREKIIEQGKMIALFCPLNKLSRLGLNVGKALQHLCNSARTSRAILQAEKKVKFSFFMLITKGTKHRYILDSTFDKVASSEST
ncbi:unnamed protein product [Lactuca virosa]|uniref:Transcription repressor n=1 Tax=Lactuca virosa TaxID=75947 RepID=A0AAU9NKE7_9ASTR|nr:unnamed protein product [Lactuca virosa]